MRRGPCGAGAPSPVAAPRKADPRPPPSLLQEPGIEPDPVQTPERDGHPRASPRAPALPGESPGCMTGALRGAGGGESPQPSSQPRPPDNVADTATRGVKCDVSGACLGIRCCGESAARPGKGGTLPSRKGAFSRKIRSVSGPFTCVHLNRDLLILLQACGTARQQPKHKKRPKIHLNGITFK